MRAAARWLPTLPVAYATGGRGTRPTTSTKGDLRMTEREQSAVTRRGFLKVGALAAAAPLLADVPPAAAQSPARSGTKVHDFQTVVAVIDDLTLLLGLGDVRAGG